MIEVRYTNDNSKTLFSKKFGEHYHSINGAVSESQHIFINLGLRSFENRSINILEVGYGTGLNAIMSLVENEILKNNIYYHGIELFPIDKNIFDSLNYSEIFNIPQPLLHKFYEFWGEDLILNDSFKLKKERVDFNSFEPSMNYDLIFFDAFSPEAQPELWQYDNIKKITDRLNAGGIFVTYCCKGVLKRNLRELSLQVKRHPGPAGKRHVLCALKK